MMGQESLQAMEIKCLKDLEAAAVVGPRTGPQKRTKAQKEWYVIRRFLKTAIPLGMLELPITIRNGVPPNEPDFVVTSNGSTVELFEVTEATNEADQAEMTAFERSGKKAALLGEFGGRFAKGASQPGLAWSTDVVNAIRRKRGKVIFQLSPVPRHLLVYPNSNASTLLSDEDDERQAVGYLRAELSEHATELALITKRCVVHIVGKYVMCLDILGEMTVISEDRQGAAYHEAGHAVVTWALGVAVGKITVGVSGDEAKGGTDIATAQGHLSGIDRLAISFAGIEAQDVFQRPTHELAGFSDVAKAMELIGYDVPEDERRHLFDAGHRRARELILLHESKISRLATSLVQQGTIEPTEFIALMKGV
jgi:hypothetical protein